MPCCQKIQKRNISQKQGHSTNIRDEKILTGSLNISCRRTCDASDSHNQASEECKIEKKWQLALASLTYSVKF